MKILQAVIMKYSVSFNKLYRVLLPTTYLAYGFFFNFYREFVTHKLYHYDPNIQKQIEEF